MRIALVAYTFAETLGGVERYVSNLARGLAVRGQDVHIVCHRSRHGRLLPGITVHQVPVTTWYSPLRYASFAKHSASFLRQQSFDVIHAFGRTTHQDICRLGGGVHWEYLLHTDRSMRSPLGRFLRRWNPRDRVILDLERRSLSPGAYRKVVCVSNRCKEEVQRYYGLPDPAIAVIPNGVDLARFTPAGRESTRRRMRDLFAVADGDRVALFAGTGFERKGLRYAIEALALLPPEASYRLWVVGRGNVAPYRRGATRLKIHDRVRFLGERDNMADFYAAADLLLLPSLYDPFPNVCLEAMACSLPVVTSRVTGVAEIIEHGVDSFVVDNAQQVLDIAACLRKLADPGTRDAVGRAARAKAEQHSLDAHIDRTLALYREVVDMKRADATAVTA